MGGWVGSDFPAGMICGLEIIWYLYLLLGRGPEYVCEESTTGSWAEKGARSSQLKHQEEGKSQQQGR